MNTAPIRVLLVEDQRDIAANIWDYLERRGYAMDHARDGVAGLRMALAGAYDLVILDLGLPRLDGLDLCRELRSSGRELPVLMLTARDTLDDKLRGFAEGADDYLVKPFAMAELEARVRAVLRRRSGGGGAALRYADLQLDPATFEATRGARRIALTRAQTTLLELLLRRAPQVVTHADLAQALWGEREADIGALHMHLHVLRGLVDRAGERALIRSVRSIGYGLDPGADAH